MLVHDFGWWDTGALISRITHYGVVVSEDRRICNETKGHQARDTTILKDDTMPVGLFLFSPWKAKTFSSGANLVNSPRHCSMTLAPTIILSG